MYKKEWYVLLHGTTGTPDWSQVEKLRPTEARERNAKLNKERSVYRWVQIQIHKIEWEA